MNNVFVGFDGSLRKPGMTILTATTLIYCGSLRTKAKGVERLAAISAYISSHVGSNLIIRSAIEGPSLESVHREYDLGEGSGVAKLALYLASYNHMEPNVIPPSQLKLYATGSGAGDKDDVIHAVKTVWGHDVKGDNDAADSYALAHIARALHLGASKRRCEAQVIHNILHPSVKTTVKHKRSKENI